MRVTFLKDHEFDDKSSVKVGESAILEDDEAAGLFAKGIVTNYTEPKSQGDNGNGEKDFEKQRKAIREIIADEIEKAGKARKAPSGKDLKGKIEVGEDEWTKDANKGFKTFGDFVVQVPRNDPADQSPEYKRYQNYCRKAALDGGTAAVLSEGGALVPPGFVNRLLEKPMADNPILSRLTTVPITSGNTVEIPYIQESDRGDGTRSGGVLAYWKAEEAQYTETKPAFGMLELRASKLTALCGMSDEVLKFSGISIEPIITRLFAKEIQFKLLNGVINGVGGGMPQGIMNSPCKIAQDKENEQAADTVIFENIANMWARLYSQLRSGGVWCVSQNVWPQLMRMSLNVGSGGSAAFLPAGGLSASPYPSLMGMPVIETEQCATLGDEGDIMLCGFSEYVWAPAGGIDAATSIHLKFDYGQTAFRFTLFADGACWWADALTPFNDGDSTGPFITLAERA